MHAIGIDRAMAEMNALGGDTDTIGSIAAQIWGVTAEYDTTPILSNVPGSARVIAVADRFADLASWGS